jgi:uncharacterized membrane protein
MQTGTETATDNDVRPVNTFPIGTSLKVSSTISLVIMVISLLWLMVTPGGMQTQAADFPVMPDQLWQGLIQLHPQAYVVLGMLLLILTPAIRLIVCLVVFAKARDYRYVVIAIITLTILVVAFLLGKGGA